MIGADVRKEFWENILAYGAIGLYLAVVWYFILVKLAT
tara:strand:- start:32 stop:145 length:114 start_codon:yes stop_codon:yes gene_type:complete